MKYKIIKMDFQSAVHFGNGGLAAGESVLPADTVFSALCCEAVRRKDNSLDLLVSAAKKGTIHITDALPFIKDRYYVPKPIYKMAVDKNEDPSIRKTYKKLAYIPVDALETYLKGEMDVVKEAEYFHDHYGKSFLVQKAAVSCLENAMPYGIGLFRFFEGSGLYMCIGCESDDEENLLLDILDSLQYSGLGGKTSSGYGQVRITPLKMNQILEKRLQNNNYSRWMSMSICLPKDDELENVLDNASYLLVRRGGFIASDTYADTARKKREMYLMKSGSTFKNKFDGDVFDVSNGGTHPVYRYAKPFFMGVI